MRQSTLKAKRSILIFCSAAVASTSFAAGFGIGFGPVFQKELEGISLQSKSAFDLSVVPNITGSLNLTSGGSTSHIRRILDERGLHPSVELKAVNSVNLNGLSLTSISGPGVATDYEYKVNGYPLCGVTLRTVQSPAGETVMVGSIPNVNHGVNLKDSDWPDLNESARKAIQGISENQKLSAANARVTKVQKCLFNEQGFLDPVWDFVISIDGFQFGVQSSENRIFSANPRYFDVTATVQAYDPNITGTLKNFSVTINDDKTLTNSFFTTSIFTGEARQTSATNTFLYTGTNPASSEASTFAYVNQHYDFVASKGYVWQGPKPLTVVVYASIKNTVNNALYTPYDGTSGPFIRVGEGDGSVLKNLAFDTDVVSHEFGHHVVYQSVTNIAGEALVLHEGLADFISFSRTGDACLGESICPANTTMASCKATNNKCLRTGDNTLVYNDATYKSYASQAHLQGQLVSGFLWDLRKNGSIPGDTLSTMVLKAITYLPSDATITNLVAALLYADSTSSSTYQKVIVSAATARGLDPSALGIDLGNLKSSLKNSTSDSSDDESKKKTFGCGALIGPGSGHLSTGSVGILAILLLFPLLSAMVPKLVPVRVPAKKRK